MRASLLLAALVMATLAIPLAQADHVFSHRVYVVGRVVDSQGLPVPGEPVGLEFHGVGVGGPCLGIADKPTDRQGDFTLCRHAHALPDDATVEVSVAGASRRLEVDPLTRHAWAHVQLDQVRRHGDLTGDRLFNRTFHVEGRVFDRLPTPAKAENVLVNATPRAGEEVLVRLEGPGGTLAEATATVDEFGFYRADLEVGEVPESSRVRVQAGSYQEGVEASTLFRRADVVLVPRADLPQSAGEGAPGTSDVPLAPVPFLVGAWALTAAACAPRRRG